MISTKPRGFYLEKAHEKWSKDKTKYHYEGAWMGIYYPLIKMSLILAFFMAFKLFFSTLVCVFLCVLIVLTYPYWVASVVPNTIVMPSMDQQTYVSNQTQLVNYMNCSMYDKGDIEAIELCFKKAMSNFPKMRYKVKEIFGDYYYEEMSV